MGTPITPIFIETNAAAVCFTYALTMRLHGVYGWLRPLLVWQFDRQIQQDLLN